MADTGKGHAVLILGESGVGKSRLAVEAAAEARNRGMAVISVRCLGRGAEPLLPLKEALAAYLGRTPDQIRRTLAHATPHLLDALPFIGVFLASIGEKLAEGSFSGGHDVRDSAREGSQVAHLSCMPATFCTMLREEGALALLPRGSAAPAG